MISVVMPGVGWLAGAAGRWFAGSEEPLPPVDQEPDDVQQAACRIVTRNPSICAPEATTPRPPSEASGPPGLDVVGLLLWTVFIAVIVWVVYLLVRQALEHSGRGTRRRHRADGDDQGEPDDVVERAEVAVDRTREPTNWRAEAEAHRAAGRFRDALRCRYRALVGDLARRGLIDEIPGRTTGEERAQLRVVRPEASRPFEAAADLFDDAWYGDVLVDAAADDRFQHHEREVLAVTTGKERR